MRFVLFLLISTLSLVTHACAEFSCSADVSYRWKKSEDAENEKVVFWGRVEAKGFTEEEGKNNLQVEVTEAKAEAVEACQRKHQNLSGCVAGKQSKINKVSQFATFSSRKALEEAISKDCSLEQGICTESTEGDIHCMELVAAVEAGAGEEAEAEEAADKGKSKK